MDFLTMQTSMIERFGNTLKMLPDELKPAMLAVICTEIDVFSALTKSDYRDTLDRINNVVTALNEEEGPL